MIIEQPFHYITETSPEIPLKDCIYQKIRKLESASNNNNRHQHILYTQKKPLYKGFIKNKFSTLLLYVIAVNKTYNLDGSFGYGSSQFHNQYR
jgi:hypothetical protein